MTPVVVKVTAILMLFARRRAVSNIVGNVIATIVLGKWKGGCDARQMRSELRLKG